MTFPKISLHAFPPSLSCTPHPALGYLKGYIESQHPNVKINTFYWNQTITNQCLKDEDWLQDVILDSYAAASLFRALFGYLFLKDRIKGESNLQNNENALEFLSAWGAFYLPNISKKQFNELTQRVDSFLNSEIHRHNLISHDIIGGSINLGQEIASLMFLHRIKLLKPSIMTIFGGMTAQEGRLLMEMFPWLDLCVYGEGESTLLEIIENYPDHSNLEKIQGIVWKQNGKIRTNPPHSPLENIDEAWANYEGYNWHIDNSVKMISIWDSRNCRWGKCTFCHRTNSSSPFRERAPESIIEEIKHHLQTQDIPSTTGFMIRFLGSDVRGSSNERFLTLLHLLSQLKDHYPNLTIFAELSPQYINEEMMKLLEVLEANIQFGFEQWSPRSLRKMRKPHRIENAIYTLKLVEKYPSVRIVGFNLLCGYPNETFEDVYTTFQTLLKLRFIFASLYKTNRKNPLRILTTPIAVNPCTPIGEEWPWENPLVQNYINTTPLTRALTYLSDNPDLAHDFVKMNSYMGMLNINNTEFLQSDLIKKYEKILDSAHISLVTSSDSSPELCMSSEGEILKLELDNLDLQIIQLTEEPTTFEDLHSQLSHISSPILLKTLSNLEEVTLMFSHNNCYINTLPYHIQTQLSSENSKKRRD